MQSQHPGFYQIGKDVESLQQRVSAIETLISHLWKLSRWGILILLWCVALLINASPSSLADLAIKLLQRALNS